MDSYDSLAAKRLTKLETRVALLESHLGIAPPPDELGISGAVLALLTEGNKLAAIKVYREETGVSLAEAMKAIEDATT